MPSVCLITWPTGIMDYNNRLSAIMVATMWSHLVVVFADLPAPGPAYDGGQLFKACQKAQKTRYALFMVGITLLLIVCHQTAKPSTT